jgi:hypothetical protein
MRRLDGPMVACLIIIYIKTKKQKRKSRKGSANSSRRLH